MSTNTGREIGWEDPIENEGPEFIILPDGDYDFEVIEFERARHNGSDKLPACNKAIVHIKIETPNGITILKENLFLHSITEGMLCAFFTAIGQRKKGERVNMNWSTVTGSRGRCKVGTRKWKGDNGQERTSNEIKRYYAPDESNNASKFEAGRF